MSSSQIATPDDEATATVEVLGKIGQRLRADAGPLAKRIADAIYREIPEFRGDHSDMRQELEDITSAAITTSVEMAARNQMSMPHEMREAYREFARSCAARGLPLHPLVQAFQVGARISSETVVNEAVANSDEIGPGVMVALKRCINFSDEGAAIVSDAYRDAQREIENRRRDAYQELVADLVLGVVGEEQLTRAIAAGLKRAPRYSVLATGLDGVAADRRLALERCPDVYAALSQTVPGSLWGTLECAGLLVVPVDTGAWNELWAAARAFEKAVQKEADTTDPLIAIGMPRPLDELALSYEEAVAILSVGFRLGLRGRVTSSELIVPRAVASAPSIARELSAVVEPLFRVPSPEGPELIETLRGFLDNGLSVRRTSEALGVHRNTVSNRLRRIEVLIGAPITSVRLALELGLIARELGFTS